MHPRSSGYESDALTTWPTRENPVRGLNPYLHLERVLSSPIRPTGFMYAFSCEHAGHTDRDSFNFTCPFPKNGRLWRSDITAQIPRQVPDTLNCQLHGKRGKEKIYDKESSVTDAYESFLIWSSASPLYSRSPLMCMWTSGRDIIYVRHIIKLYAIYIYLIGIIADLLISIGCILPIHVTCDITTDYV